MNGEILIKIPSLKANEIDFNGGTLEISQHIPRFGGEIDRKYVRELVNAMHKSRYKDAKAMREFNEVMTADREREEDSFSSKQSTRFGIIQKLPSNYTNTKGFDVECEPYLKEGDKVWFDAFYSREESVAEGRYLKDESGEFILAPYQVINGINRDGEIIPANGYFFGELLDNTKKIGGLFIPDEKKKIVKVKVTHAPPVQAVNHNPLWRNSDLNIGDVVFMEESFAVPLDSTLASKTNLVRFRSRIIIAIERD